MSGKVEKLVPEASRCRIGMLTPSSNTRLEPVTQRMTEGLSGVSVHYTRIPVHRISLEPSSQGQFEIETMVASARLLADAQVDVIAWNGTSGSWLGLEHDRAICAEIEAETGIPATTSTLALFESVRAIGARECGLAVPYERDLTEQIVRVYAGEGIKCTSVANSGLIDNLEIGRLSHAEVDDLVSRAHGASVEAVLVVCTNVDAASRSLELERRLSVPVIDSIAVTLWGCLRIRGQNTTALAGQWGSIFDIVASTRLIS